MNSEIKKYGRMSPFIFQTISKYPTRLYFKLVHKLDVQGLKHFDALSKKQAIFAVNHTSEWDPILLSAVLPVTSPYMPLYYVAAGKSFYSKSSWRQGVYGGRFFELMGAYAATQGLHDFEEALKHHLVLLEQRKSICIFPEGVRTRDGSIGEAKKGTAFLAHKSGVPIIPVHMTGMFKRKFGQKVSIHFGEPFYVRDTDYHTATRTLMEKISEL